MKMRTARLRLLLSLGLLVIFFVTFHIKMHVRRLIPSHRMSNLPQITRKMTKGDYLEGSNRKEQINDEDKSRHSWFKNGAPEREQLLYYWRFCEPASKSTSCYREGNQPVKPRYQFNVTMIKDGLLCVFIEERDDDASRGRSKTRPSRGGSNFRVEVVGKEYSVCPVRDFFNGSYAACCDDVTSSVIGTIYLDFTHFKAFRHHENPGLAHPDRINRKIHTFRYAYPKKWGSNLKNYDRKSCDNAEIKEYFDGHWWKSGNKWQWKSKSGCVFQVMRSTDILKCYKEKTTFRIFGDSHLRFVSNYMNQVLFKFPEFQDIAAFRKTNKSVFQYDERKEVVGIAKTIYNWTAYGHQCLENIASVSLSFIKKPATKDDVILFGFGIHELVTLNHSARNFLERVLPRFLDFLADLRRNPRTTNIRLIFLNMLPRVLGQMDGNDYMVAAVNEIIGRQLVNHGVEVVDGFNMINPMKWTQCDGAHYLCPVRNDPSEYAGATGMTLAHLLFRLICNNH